MTKTSEDMGDTMIKLIDKLAGKESDMSLFLTRETLWLRSGQRQNPSFHV